MGCTASKVLPNEVDGPLGTVPIAQKLSQMLDVPESALQAALPGLNRCFARRLPDRRIYKPLDLWVLTSFIETADGTHVGGSGADSLPSDVKAELAKLKAPVREAVTKMLQNGHRCGGWIPKIGIGNASIYKNLPSEEHAPVAHAFEEGNRLIPIPDPVPHVPPMDSTHDGVAMGKELAGKDMSRNVLFGGYMCETLTPSSWTPEEIQAPLDKIKKSMALFKERIGHTAGTFDAAGQELGQPCYDVYTTMAPVSIGAKMAPQCNVPIDVHWRALEELVYSGDTRTIGVSNFTKLQLQGLLATCRIRPAVIWMESHPWSDSQAMQDLIEFCLSEGIAVVAHTPLAQASRLDDERLVTTDMTPAQAALRWHIDKGMSVTVGVKEKWMIKENLNTPLDKPVQTLAPPEKPLFTQMALFPGFRQLIAPGDGGCLRTGEDGHLYGHTISAERQLRVEQQYSLTKKHLSVFSTLVPIIKQLPQKADVQTRRKLITTSLAGLADAAKNTGEASAILAQMQVVPLAAFDEHKSVPRRSFKGKVPQLHMSVASLPENARILFFSQRWLRKDHPDDEKGSKHGGVAVAARAWAALEGVDESDVYVWFDFCSVEQDDFTEMVACINALGLYIACCDAFISFEHPEYWGRAWCLVEQLFGDAVRMPRYELKASGELELHNDGKTLEQKLVDPMVGDLSVENDRGVIDMLTMIGSNLRAQLYYGVNAQFMTAAIIDLEVEKYMSQAGDGDVTAQHGVTA
jgi:hypothetical protein